ncbi:MAG: glycosyltransferase family 2 protein [Thermoanaerobacteraceae bacterium]|nr:glycosyltransferase family 2 protein [Thermoanaerobacteraceae bacterium]
MKIIGNIWWFLGWYVFLYPLALSIVWSILGFYFWWRRERNPDKEKKNWPDLWPPITILMPCHNESAGIAAICTSLQLLNYPDYQVIFIDDASTDDTAALIRHFLPDNPNFHLLSLTKNCGKAQAAEFASIIGLIKRSQRVIGRVLTVSGCATAYRTEVLKEVGGFSFKTATEDIDITWKIQRHFYEVWFAPQAAVFIQCPSTFKEYWKQRRRWALGGWHLLRTHKDIFKDLKWRYLYPTYLEFVLSTFWAFVFVFGTIYWLITYFFKLSPIGFSPIPAWYGALISIVCIFQMAIALFLNHRYDPKLYRTFFWIPWYPIFFFAFGAITIVWTAPKGLFGSLENAGRWKSPKRQVANS